MTHIEKNGLKNEKKKSSLIVRDEERLKKIEGQELGEVTLRVKKVIYELLDKHDEKTKRETIHSILQPLASKWIKAQIDAPKAIRFMKDDPKVQQELKTLLMETMISAVKAGIAESREENEINEGRDSIGVKAKSVLGEEEIPDDDLLKSLKIRDEDIETFTSLVVDELKVAINCLDLQKKTKTSQGMLFSQIKNLVASMDRDYPESSEDIYLKVINDNQEFQEVVREKFNRVIRDIIIEQYQDISNKDKAEYFKKRMEGTFKLVNKFPDLPKSNDYSYKYVEEDLSCYQLKKIIFEHAIEIFDYDYNAFNNLLSTEGGFLFEMKKIVENHLCNVYKFEPGIKASKIKEWADRSIVFCKEEIRKCFEKYKNFLNENID